MRMIQSNPHGGYPERAARVKKYSQYKGLYKGSIDARRASAGHRAACLCLGSLPWRLAWLRGRRASRAGAVSRVRCPPTLAGPADTARHMRCSQPRRWRPARSSRDVRRERRRLSGPGGYMVVTWWLHGGYAASVAPVVARIASSRSGRLAHTRFDQRCEMRVWNSSTQQPPEACASAPRFPCQKHV